MVNERPDYIPIEKLADFLSLTVPTVRAWTRRGIIPNTDYIKVGQTYRYNWQKVLNTLHNTTFMAQPVEENPQPVQLELDLAPPTDDL